MENKTFLPLLFFVIFSFAFVEINPVIAQLELVPVQNKVYPFLKRMQLLQIIEYNSAVIPKSRMEIAGYLKIIRDKRNSITKTDNKILEELFVEFEYDVSGTVNRSTALFKDLSLKNIFSNDKQKYLYFFTDSLATLFFDGSGYLSERSTVGRGDSLSNSSALLGGLGLGIRGTLLNSVGYYLKISNGLKLAGNKKSQDFVIETDPKFKSNVKFRSEYNAFDDFTGYVRGSSKYEIVTLMAGHDNIYSGFGYNDKLFLSGNSVPFSFVKLGLNYKALRYFFLYGSLKGDSLGRDTKSKTIASHRLDINFSNKFRMGIFESLIISDAPFNFTYLVPLSFLRSADYKTGGAQSTLNNALMGIDFEYQPFRKISVQGSLLMDDINLSTPEISNKFGWQLGAMWTDAFTINDLTGTAEYTRLDPFVYTHRTNKSNYTNWSLSLGHALPPNSDEFAFKLDYNFSGRLSISALYQYQRSSDGYIIRNDSLIVNYGGNLNRGDGDGLSANKFLQGNRYNKNIFTFNLKFEPLKQFYIDLKFVLRNFDILYRGISVSDKYFFLTFAVDY